MSLCVIHQVSHDRWRQPRRSNSPGKKVDIVLVVEGEKLLLCGPARLVDVHILVQTISQYQVVRERQSLWLHGMSLLRDEKQPVKLFMLVCVMQAAYAEMVLADALGKEV